MFSVSPEIYSVLSVGSRWLFAFFALMLLVFAFGWHRADRRENRERFKHLPGAGTVGELAVLSGSDELPRETWFPVPREGVLGSLRSCDLVIPCPGVSSHHLDFYWQDGTGLMIRPRAGCHVLVDGVPVSRRGAFADTPLLHGSVLQVGSAVLRLQLFSALADTNRTFIPARPVPGQENGGTFPPVPVPGPWPASPPPGSWSAAPEPGTWPVSPEPDSWPSAPEPGTWPVSSEPGSYPSAPEPDCNPAAPEQTQAAVRPAPRPRRSDRWKEDWSE